MESKRSFVPGPSLIFNESSVASRSKYNPVRQYNKDKPDKFHVNFFIMANANPRQYFIVHIDIYQGRNTANIDIDHQIKWLPTTQKAVVNAAIKLNIAMDPDGMRCIYMDKNRYQCTELALLLREKYQIYSVESEGVE